MTVHGGPRVIYQNAIERAKGRTDHFIKEKRWGIKHKPWHKRSPQNQAHYDAAVEFNKAHGLKPRPRVLRFKGMQRRSQKRVTLPTFKSE